MNTTQTTDAPQWVTEFGPDFAVPDCIAKAPDVTDQSWHNDVCPKFWMQHALMRDGKRYRVEIWADHPEQAERETQGADRFWLMLAEVDFDDVYQANDEDRQIWEGDDAEALMRTARNLFKPPTPEQLARKFADVLKSWLSRDEMEAVIRRNKADNDPLVCASHDFCDANMAMHEAMDMGLDTSSAEMAALWSEAWDIAKAANFWFE